MSKPERPKEEKKPKGFKCPTCKGPVAPRLDNPDFPFCSARCKAVDLAKWFTGSYAVPGEKVPGDDEKDS